MLRQAGRVPPSFKLSLKYGGELFGEAIGLVQEGYLADLILVDGAPSKHISILQDANRLPAIMKDGALHKRPSTTAEQRLAAE